jgi:phosphatidyl-myo-inositol dimannoside synthase
MSRPTVLFITRSLQSAPGGMQSFTRGLLEALNRRDDVAMQVVGFTGSKVLLPFFLIKCFVCCLFTRHARVHVGDALLLPVARCGLLLRPSVRLSATVHGLDAVYPHAVYQWLLHDAFIRCDRIAAVSNATAEEAIVRGAPRAGVHVIPCGVAGGSFVRIPPRDRFVLSVGRLVKRKGITWFIANVWPALAARYPGMRYVIAGDGPDRVAVRAAIAHSGSGKRIDFLGAVSEAQKRELLSSAALLAMPNIRVAGDMEGFGMVCIEAAMHGLPVVAAKLEGIVDAVHEGETGLLYEAGDGGQAVAAFTAGLERKWSPQALAETCQRHYSIGNVAARYSREIFPS